MVMVQAYILLFIDFPLGRYFSLLSATVPVTFTLISKCWTNLI